MKLGWTLVREGFGRNTKQHFLTKGFLTETQRGKKAKPYNNIREQMKWRRDENIASTFCKLEMKVLPY